MGQDSTIAPPVQARGFVFGQEEPVATVELLVRLRDGQTWKSLRIGEMQEELTVLRRIPQINVWLASASMSRRQEIGLQLDRNAHVLWFEPNGLVHASGLVPDDNYYWAQQGHLRLIGMPDAWVFDMVGAPPIAILDSGIDIDHPDLGGKVWSNPGEVPNNGEDDDGNSYIDDVNGWDFVHGDSIAEDDHGHGSHVSGIAAAETDNGIGIAGVAWHTPLMPLKVLDNQGVGEWADVAEAIIYAADNGARVLNLSFGGVISSSTVGEAVEYAQNQGSLLVAASGNITHSSVTAVEYPAALPGVLAVAATTGEDEAWSEGKQGLEVDLAAPGVNILSASRYGSYYFGTGTSAATPHVSGIASLLWTYQPALTADQIANVLTTTVQDVHSAGRDEQTGWGRVDAREAMLSLVQPQIALSVDYPSVWVGLQTATVTATVSYSQGLTVPDGLTVEWSTTLGRVEPNTAYTHSGWVTTTFSSDRFGMASINASVGSLHVETLSVQVVPYRCYLPLISATICDGDG